VISGLVLAAGTGSRFGGTKQLVEIDGRPLVLHAVASLRDAGVDEIVVGGGHRDEIVVVTLHHADAVEEVLPDDVRRIRNPSYREGQASSLGAGLHALHDDSEAAIVLMADQPGVEAEDVKALIDGFRATRARIVRLRYRNGPGPALLSREIYSEAGHLHGDSGARVLMASHPDWLRDVAIDRPSPRDIDRPDDLV
jgi:molybdenum cofactor cytidylyltransferase